MRTLITNQVVNKILYPHPYSTWLNKYTIRQMEVAVVKDQKLHFRRFARFNLDYEAVEFMIWPICYLYSWRIRFQQRRLRIFTKFIVVYSKLSQWLDKHHL